MIYFTADLHLGHKNVVQLCHRPFSTAEEMDEALISRWNDRVGKKDTVYIVGDLLWDKKQVAAYLSRLQGQKILITGNHDAQWLKAPGAADFFQQILPYLQLRTEGRSLTLCHYPLLEWAGSRPDDGKHMGYLIHGHIHNRIDPLYDSLFRRPHALNAGVDINHYRPVTFEELLENNMRFKAQLLKED